MLRQYSLDEPKARRSPRIIGDDTVDDQDAFLDRMSGILESIARECSTVGASGNAKAVLAKASTAFENVQRMCHEAGIVHADTMDGRGKSSQGYKSPEFDMAAVKPIDFSLHAPPSYPPVSKNREHHRFSLSSIDSDNESVAASTPTYYRAPPSSGDDIIQVEITDILTSTQEEIQRWKHEFRVEMMEQEARHHEEKKAHLEQIHTLKEALEESQKNIAKLCREVGDTNAKLEAFQALTNKSHKAMELTLREHTQYWKAICHDLVAEKKSIATKLAEERGKSHALREHLGMHESQGKSSIGDTHRGSGAADEFTTQHTTSRFQNRQPGAHFDEEPATFRRYYLAKKPSAS